MILRRFYPTLDQLAVIDAKLKDGYLYLPDEYREDVARQFFMAVVFNPETSEHYEIGDFGGIVSFYDILPGYKCGAMMKIWDKKYWGSTVVREAREAIESLMSRYNLSRVSIEGADDKLVRIGEMLGMENEGVRFKSFMWDGKLYPVYMMAKVREAEV